MATLDETNIFGLTPNQPEKKDDSLSRLGISESGYLNRLAQIQNMRLAEQEGVAEVRSARGAEKKVLRDQYLADLREAAKDPTQEKRDTALESFFETPFPFQMGQYVFDPTGVPTDISEFDYASRKLEEEFEKDPLTFAFNPATMGYEPMYTPKQREYTNQRNLALLGIPPGIGGIAGIFKSMLGFPARALRTGKTMDGQGGGIGGLSKEEFIQKEIETKARDGAFFSPLNKYLITKAPKNLKGQALLDHIVANQSKGGYKLDEIKLTGVDQYLVENPQANTQELIDYASQNKPKVFSKVFGDAESMDEIFLPSVADPLDPLDMTDHSLVRSADILEDLKKGDEDIFDSPNDVNDPNLDWASVYYNAYANQRISKEGYERLMNKIGVSKPGILPVKTNLPADVNNLYLIDRRQGMFEDLADEMSMKDFFDDPYKLIELDEGVGLDLKAYGNDSVGYALIKDGQKLDLEREIYTEGEALNQMRRIVDDEGVLDGLDGIAKYKSYILNEKMPHVGGTDYQEIQLNMPILDDRGFRIFDDGHYEADFEIGTLAKIDSKLADGTDTMHIPEFQSDVHQKGAGRGYDTPKDKKYYDEVKIPQLAKDFEAQAKKILGFDDREFEQLKKSLDAGELLDSPQSAIYKKISDQIKDIAGGVTPSTWDEYSRAINTRNNLTPNYPHKDFVPFVVKHMVAKAIKEGKDTISFPTSTSILERTKTQPRKVGNIEVAQISPPTDIDKQIYDLSRNTEKLEYQAVGEFGKDFNQYFDDLDSFVEVIVDLKNMDNQLKQYPNVDFSNANTRREYVDFEIDFYRDTLDDEVYNVEKLEQFARDYEKKLNELGYEVVERPDVTASPRLQEIYDEYGDVASGSQLRRMEVDAMQETQPLTAKAYERGYDGKEFNDLLYNKNTDTFITAKNLQNDARSKVVSQGEFVINDPSLVDIDGAGIKSYPTYSSIERTFGSSVAKQIRKLAEEGKIPQSFDSYFYDLADGNRGFNTTRLVEKFENSLPYSFDVNKEIGGEKFITDYDKKLPSALEKIAKDYGGKFEKGSLDAETVYGSKLDLEGEDVNEFMPAKRLEVNILRITPEMKKKVLEEGMPQMYKGGIVNKVKSMDKPIQGNRREI